jgi:ribose/xylose/arabinose/galactoside ABC-type transport system permease subunit
MKRVLPAAIAMATGFLVLVDFFFDNLYLNALGVTLINWVVIIAAFALILGFLNVLAFHLRKIVQRQEGWLYSIALLVVAGTVLFGGLTSVQGYRALLVRTVFDYVQAPLQASIFSLLAFYIASAGYRALRARNFETFLLVVTCLVVLVGQAPLARYVWKQLPALKDWVLGVPSTAGARGILIGVALGSLATGVRVLVGFDRPYSE